METVTRLDVFALILGCVALLSIGLPFIVMGWRD